MGKPTPHDISEALKFARRATNSLEQAHSNDDAISAGQLVTARIQLKAALRLIEETP